MNMEVAALSTVPEADMIRPADQPAGQGEAGGKKVNILIVDDKPDKLVALESVLTDLHQNILKASSGKEALRMLLQQDFAVILLDVNMPVMDGFETAALIRQRKNSEHTPIIFVTANTASENYIYKGYSLGAVDYIFTPVVPEVLRAKVLVFVELLKKSEEIRRQAEQLRQMQEQEHQRRLAEARERLEVQTVRNRFFVLGINLLAIAGFDGVLKQLNPTWERVLGFPEADLMASPFINFVHPEDREATSRELDQARGSGLGISFENRFACQDGTYRWLDWTITPFAQEKLLYIFARDITEKKKTEEALHETNTELESFSYTVSHDLRAPLRAMQGFADALLKDYAEELDDLAKDYANRIVHSAKRMDTLIQDLLIYSRLTRAELPLKALSLDGVLSDAMSQLESEVEARKADIKSASPLGTVLGHQATLVQVVVNLIGNGIKFVAPETRPVVSLRTEVHDEVVRLWIEDNGIGIPEEYHARIFRVFERLHGVDDYPGTGVGLAIVRKGVERMGGRIGLVSSPGAGSKFWIELPQVK